MKQGLAIKQGLNLMILKLSKLNLNENSGKFTKFWKPYKLTLQSICTVFNKFFIISIKFQYYY